MSLRNAAALVLAVPLIACAAPSILVASDWLAAHLQDKTLVILHVGAAADYAAGHIPGARLIGLGDVSITDPSGLRLELPPVDRLVEAFGHLGVTGASQVVVYSGNGTVQSATRIWFTLDYLGLGSRSVLLDGGLAQWRAEGRPVTTAAAPAIEPSRFTPHPDPSRVVLADWLKDHLADPQVHLVDARLPEYFSGSNAGGMPRAGHIPGARNIPYLTLLAENGKFKPASELRAALGASTSGGSTVSYCHIGQQATVIYFAARYLDLDAHLYDGSFQDWSRRSELPIDAALPTGRDEAFAAALEAVFSPLAGRQSPGLAVLVRSQGRILFQRAYGARELSTLTPLDGHTDFRLASVTKQFTAMAAMLLIHEGKLKFGSTLTEIFPEFPAYGRAITIRHLLTHTSGLPDYEDLMDAYEKSHGPTWSSTHQIQDHEVLDLLEHQAAGKFAPGTAWSYSNSGYVVLGLVVAKISGERFGQFLEQRIFSPLHMTGTLVYEQGRNTVPNRAFGHSRASVGFQESDQSATSATQGDGGIYSNLADLARWDDALANHTLLSAEEMRPALEPVKLSNGAQPKWPIEPGGDNLSPGNPVFYGYGWFLDPLESHQHMWHFGSTSGFRTAIERFPGDGLTIVILANRTDLDPGALAEQSARIVFAAK